MRHAVEVLRVRRADVSDLETIAALTRRRRALLAQWSPAWWRPARHSDDLHQLWLTHLFGSADAACYVVENDDDAVGCAIAIGQSDRWIVDDLAVDDERWWPDVAAALVAGIAERPALSCIPTADAVARAAVAAAGLTTVSTYWIVSTTREASEAAFDPLVGDVPVPPPHTFAPLFAPGRAMCLRQVDGVAVASASLPAPPVYDPGGTVRIVDRVIGGDPHSLLCAVLAAAYQAGDVLACVVTAPEDDALAKALQQLGASPTVEALMWP